MNGQDGLSACLLRPSLVESLRKKNPAVSRAVIYSRFEKHHYRSFAKVGRRVKKSGVSLNLRNPDHICFGILEEKSEKILVPVYAIKDSSSTIPTPAVRLDLVELPDRQP